jgi:hypothetical protein
MRTRSDYWGTFETFLVNAPKREDGRKGTKISSCLNVFFLYVRARKL